MYQLKTASKHVAQALTGLAEGMDLSAAVRVFEHGEGTMRCWLARAGARRNCVSDGERLHERHFRNLWLEHVQLDELVVQIRGKGRDLWLWVALEAETKLMPVLQLGPRTQEVAHGVVHSLAGMLAPECVPAFTSDGLNVRCWGIANFYSLTAHFGEWQENEEGKVRWVVSPPLVYAQLKKIRVWRRLVGTEQRVLCGTRAMLTERLHGCGLRATIQTAFVERVNLTLRQSVAGLVRRTWSVAAVPAELEPQRSCALHPDVVPGVLPLFASAREPAVDVHEHQRQGRGSRALPEPHAGDGGQSDPAPIQCQGVVAASAASSKLTRSGVEKATERGLHGRISLPVRRPKAITESCTGPKDPCKATGNCQLRPMGGPTPNQAVVRTKP